MREEHYQNFLQRGQAEDILPGGECVVRCGDDVYLISNAVPGDELYFQPIGKRRGAARGSLQDVIMPSEHRINAVCDVASMCGGCALQYILPSEQLVFKSEWVRQAFVNCFDAETAWQPLEHFSCGKRRRVRWYVGKDDTGRFLGFHARSSHDVIHAESCMVITPELDGLRKKIQHCLQDDSDIDAIQAIQLVDGIHVIVETKYRLNDNPFFSLGDMNGLPIQYWQRQDRITRPFIKPVQTFHDCVMLDDQKNIDIDVGPDDFIQGQQEGNQVLIEQVLDWCQGVSFVVDLFSGIGNLSMPIAAKLGARVVGSELSSASVRSANSNAKRLQLQAKYYQMNLFDKIDLQHFSGADVLILDPPRKGAKRICQQMGSLLPKKIIMINCDVASAGRDADILHGIGYILRELKAIDLFPYAGHVEAMSLWSR